MTASKFTHLDEHGRGRMVDVSEKDITFRRATAQAKVFMKEETVRLIKERGMAKGDVLGVAQVAGIMAAKHTPFLIPMCHPLFIDGVELQFGFEEPGCLVIQATVNASGRTGVEMESLAAASIAALTVYDMCKAVDKEMHISQVCLLEKEGGRSGRYVREVDGK